MADPTCPNCGHPIPEDVLRKAGAAAMGRAATGKAKARTSEQASKAARASAAVRTAKAAERKALSPGEHARLLQASMEEAARKQGPEPTRVPGWTPGMQPGV